MSRQGLIAARAAGGPRLTRARAPRALGCLAVAAILGLAAGTTARAQNPAPVPGPAVTPLTPLPAPVVPNPYGVATTMPAAPAAPVAPALPAEVQVVLFRVPEGVTLEVLGPPPEPLPPGQAGPGVLVGMRVGVGYRLRLANLPRRPGVELYPVIEVVGHLHRPAGVDPLKFPIRVWLTELDLEEAADHGRLVTQVIYLEDPDQALPMSLPRDEIPIATLNPVEDPLRVGSALGRAMAIVRFGRRVPNPEEWATGAGDVALAASPCPFSTAAGARCSLPLGFARGTAPPPGHTWLPRDEYLCDGGDRAEAVHFGGDGALRGIDPRDAVIQFQAGFRPRVLPTNMVCLYAPRFAAVRTSVGPNEALVVQVPRGTEILQKEVVEQALFTPRRLTQNETAELNAHRARAAGMVSRTIPFQYTEVRILRGYDLVTHIAGHVLTQAVEMRRNRQAIAGVTGRNGPLTIKTAESAVVTGIIQSGSQAVMAWKPQELVGVELKPPRPGMAVIKRVSADVAEPGDLVTFSIQYRNMGNVPIGSVSIVDSLMPRLEYVAGSAQGPAGTVFTATDNRGGSAELRWDLPGMIAPGGEGYVTFQARVR